MGSLPLEQERTPEHHHGNMVAFLRTCSRPDLSWFMDAVTANLLNIVRESEDSPSKGTKTRIRNCSPENILVDTTTRSVSFVESKPLGKTCENIFAVLATFLADLLALALGNDHSESPKQSRIRTKITMIFVVEGIHERMRNAFSHGGRRFQKELWAQEVLKHQQWLGGTQDGGEAEAMTGSTQDRTKNGGPDYPLRILSHEVLNEASRPPQGCTITTRAPTVHVNGGTHSVNREVTVVVPAGGRSSRFPGHKPKWLLTQPNGCLMVVDALGSLNMTAVGHVVVGILKDHLDRFCGGDAEALLKAFEDGHPRLQQIPISIVVIPEETVDQAQTLECILAAAKITGPIFLKDCDNQFACPVSAIDGIATQEITRDVQSISIPAAKSYVSLAPTGLITNIAEKVILSNTFCIGGYSFRSASSTIASIAAARRYQKLTSTCNIELSISDLVWLKMLTEHATFVSIPATAYEDWGTLAAWEAYTRTWKTLFVDIDGTLLKNTGQYFPPSWSKGSGIVLPRNVAHLRSLHARGRTQIVLTTTRPEAFREVTERVLRDGGVPFDTICFGLFHAQRVLINDWAKTNPFPSAVAVNLRRDGDDLVELLAY